MRKITIREKQSKQHKYNKSPKKTAASMWGWYSKRGAREIHALACGGHMGVHGRRKDAWSIAKRPRKKMVRRFNGKD